MALRMQKLRKEFLTNRLRQQVERSALVAVMNVGNMPSAQKDQARRALREVGGDVMFTKNSLTARGLEAAGASELIPLLKGPTALALGPAELPLASSLHSLSQKLPDFFVLGAKLNHRRVLEFMEVEKLAKLPPAEVIHSTLVSQILPGSTLHIPNVGAVLATLLQAHADSLAAAAAEGGGAVND